jgi:hypothetical protein
MGKSGDSSKSSATPRQPSYVDPVTSARVAATKPSPDPLDIAKESELELRASAARSSKIRQWSATPSTLIRRHRPDIILLVALLFSCLAALLYPSVVPVLALGWMTLVSRR